MTDKFTYYANFGSGFEQIEILDNSLHLVREVPDDWPGAVEIKMDGSFKLFGNYFDTLETKYQTSGNIDIPFRVYENGDSSTGTLIFNGYFTNFCNFDYNEKKVEIKDVIKEDYTTRLLRKLNNKTNFYWMYFYGSYEIIRSNEYLGAKITDVAFKFQDVLNNALANGSVDLIDPPPVFDETDGWFDAEQIAFDNIYLAQANLLYKDASNLYGEWTQANGNPLTVRDILDFMQNGLQAFCYVDNSGYLKFKKIVDLIYNTLDVSQLTSKLNQKYYDIEKNYKRETFTMHPNNNLDEREDFMVQNIDYDRASNKPKRDIDLKFMTNYLQFNEIDTSAWFIAFIEPSAFNYIRYEQGYVSGTNQDNARFSTANMLNLYHREYIHTDNINFSICGNASAVAPEYYQNYIALPNLTIILNSIETFYDSLLWKVENGYNFIAKVKKMDTDLSTNITTFESHLFRKYSS